jgi:putative mRNA 3-end processing factor
MSELIVAKPEGLYCPPGDFFIDPWHPVPMAIITHPHSDHARRGSSHYLATELSKGLLYKRLGDIHLETLAYGHQVNHNGVKISFHPAGHVLGSAQIRLEYQGEVWVVSGDYKLEDDGLTQPFEPVKCHTFITESTFGLPIYQWQTQSELQQQINSWWSLNASNHKTSIIYCYALGKAQRLLSLLDYSIGPILTHGAVEPINEIYRQTGLNLPATEAVAAVKDKSIYKKAIVIAPPSARGTPWLKRFGDYSDAFTSGWMQVRGRRRMLSLDRGFPLSDHADWPGLVSAIEQSRAEQVYVTHGFTQPLVRWLNEKGLPAHTFITEYGSEDEVEDIAESEVKQVVI